jgi:hypothetical protein
MDPRSPATAQDLEQQLKLAEQIYGEALECRRVIGEIGSVQKQLSELKPKLQESELKASAEDVTTKIKAILSGDANEAKDMGLETASAGLGGALRVVESGDRAVPAQALEVYKLASAAKSMRVDEWKALKAGRLAQLNQELSKDNFAPISTGEAKGP